MAFMAKRVARRRGRVSKIAVLKQMRAAVSVCLARRAARMSLACWPRVHIEAAAVSANTACDAFLHDAAADWTLQQSPYSDIRLIATGTGDALSPYT